MKPEWLQLKGIASKRIIVLYTSVEHALTDVPDELRESVDLAENARSITNALRDVGHRVGCVEFGNDVCRLSSRLLASKAEIVFNLAECPLHCYDKEPHAAALLELLKVPYTGNSPFSLVVCKDKALTKQILLAHGLPSPRFRVYSSSKSIKLDLCFPLVVKPLREDGSIGIVEESVVENQGQLCDRIAQVLEQQGQPALVEEFVGGREFNVVVMGNGTRQDPYRALPPGEYVYHAQRWRVCTFEAKWNQKHPSYAAVEACYPAKIPASLRRRLQKMSVACCQIFELSGYARIDFRLDATGEPYVLEVNPNPDLSPDAGSSCTAQISGLSYPEFLQEIVRLGLAKGAR